MRTLKGAATCSIYKKGEIAVVNLEEGNSGEKNKTVDGAFRRNRQSQFQRNRRSPIPKESPEAISQESSQTIQANVMEGTEKKETGESFPDLIQEYKTPRLIKQAEIIPAKVVQVNKEGILLDIGRKSEGFMPWEMFSSSRKNPPQVGEMMQVYVVGKGEKGRVLLSKKEADFRLDWEKFSRAFKEGKPVLVKVEKIIKGGLLASLGSLRAFIPASHISLKKENNLRKFLGKEMLVRVIELDKNSKNIVLSRKFFLLEEKEKRREQALSNLEEGKVVRGRVNSITRFGVFVDLGGIDGLIHPENLSWGWVRDPNQIVSVGDKIKVKVLKLNKEKKRISLGLKQTKPDPWTQVEKKYRVGSQVEGRVTHLADFGAFVEIEEGLEGLIHISDFSWDKRIRHPRQVVKEGEKVKIKILSIDVKEKRIALGLKQIKPDPWEELLQGHKIGDVVSGKVEEITDFGIFVNLSPGIDGFIHVSELDKEYVSHPSKIALVGDEIKAEIIEIDEKKRRIRLSIRRLKKREKEEKKGKKKVEEENDQFFSFGEEGVMLSDFIEEKVKEKLKKSFENEN